MKADPQLFLACPFIGFITLDGVAVCMLRNCPRCLTTLGLSMVRVMDLYPMPAGVDWVSTSLERTAIDSDREDNAARQRAGFAVTS